MLNMFKYMTINDICIKIEINDRLINNLQLNMMIKIKGIYNK